MGNLKAVGQFILHMKEEGVLMFKLFHPSKTLSKGKYHDEIMFHFLFEKLNILFVYNFLNDQFILHAKIISSLNIYNLYYLFIKIHENSVLRPLRY